MSKNTLNILEKKAYIHPWSLLQSHENGLLNLKEVQQRQNKIHFFFIFLVAFVFLTGG
jgi:hypothetical protein